jgi:hypothetical protein
MNVRREGELSFKKFKSFKPFKTPPVSSPASREDVGGGICCGLITGQRAVFRFKKRIPGAPLAREIYQLGGS